MSGVVQTAVFTASIVVPGSVQVSPGRALVESRQEQLLVEATSGESADDAIAALRDFAFQILVAITPEGTEYPAPPWVGK